MTNTNQTTKARNSINQQKNLLKFLRCSVCCCSIKISFILIETESKAGKPFQYFITCSYIVSWNKVYLIVNVVAFIFSNLILLLLLHAHTSLLSQWVDITLTSLSKLLPGTFTAKKWLMVDPGNGGGSWSSIRTVYKAPGSAFQVRSGKSINWKEI